VTGKPVLIIDSCSDLPADVVEDLGVEVLNFPYTLSGKEHLDDFGRAQSHADFYAAMRAGDHPTTAQIPRQVFLDTFRTHAAAGEAVLYLGFSSALSGTFDVAWLARQDVLTEYPHAEIRLIDTRAAAVAEGLLVYEAALRWRDGMPLAERDPPVVAAALHAGGSALLLAAANAMARPNRICSSFLNPWPTSPKANVIPVATMIRMAIIRATGPVIESMTAVSGPSQGMPPPPVAACAAPLISIIAAPIVAERTAVRAIPCSLIGRSC